MKTLHDLDCLTIKREVRGRVWHWSVGDDKGGYCRTKADALNDALSVLCAQFDNIEVHPCRVVGITNGVKQLEQCDEDAIDIECWSVYGHYRPTTERGGLECLVDCDNRIEAESLSIQLMVHVRHQSQFVIWG